MNQRFGQGWTASVMLALWAVASLGAIASSAQAADAPGATQPTQPTQPATQPADIDPRAREVLRAAARYLDDAKSYTFSADVWEDVVLPSGRKVQRQRTTQVGVRRPDRFYAESHNERVARGLWYDGKTVTIYNRQRNFYGTVPAPGTIDEMVALIDDKFGISTPLSDLLISDMDAAVTRNIRRGDYLGRQTVAGVRCNHLAFVQPDIDWELWVQDAKAPVIRKIVIIDKQEDGAPQFTATLSDWNFDARLPDFAFTFRPPLNAVRIDVLASPSTSETPGGGAAPPTQPTPRKE